ncbi:helix-turn-helix domain-containing protein [Faecalibacillus intestinalis]|uniref:helix-turn-helix domain-containing protein n=1 Tax=Faecalibacillus intestinalis TaxID=1982626 RepID=UPI00295F36F9|nr:helix-turn-helix domain-containing protein [Faecalibacillus intestinalis]
MVYGIISSHPGLNAKQISEILTLKKSSIETAIKGLKKKDIIEHTGSRAYGGYVVKK